MKSQKKWRGALLLSKATIEQAIENLNKNAIKIVLVANNSGKLVGTISDGDIRRGLLKNLSLHNSIESIINKNPLVATPEMGRDIVKQLMVANKIQQIPVVDKQRNVVGLYLWDEMTTTLPRENIMLVMAGGLGTRLGEYTLSCPKPLLPIAGKPMIEHIIERAKLEGFNRFLIAINYLGHMIEQYFGCGERLGVEINYLREKTPLGTAGALSLIHPRPVVPIIVTNGDVITDIKYGELLDFHIRHGASATMAVRLHEWQNPFGVVQTEGVEIVGLEEKPVVRSHINAGVYALNPDSLSLVKKTTACDMTSFFEILRNKGKRTVAYPMHEPWLDIGRPEDLNRANAEK